LLLVVVVVGVRCVSDHRLVDCCRRSVDVLFDKLNITVVIIEHLCCRRRWLFSALPLPPLLFIQFAHRMSETVEVDADEFHTSGSVNARNLLPSQGSQNRSRFNLLQVVDVAVQNPLSPAAANNRSSGARGEIRDDIDDDDDDDGSKNATAAATGI
jgi:hypothetical protein